MQSPNTGVGHKLCSEELYGRIEPVDLSKQSIPPGHHLVEGTRLQATARKAKIEFAPVTRKCMLPSGQQNNTAVGIIVRDCDREAIEAAMAHRAAKKAKDIQFKCRQKS